MSDPRASLVLIGQVVVSAGPGGLQTAEAIGIADGRVVAVGSRDEVLDAKASNARLVAAGTAAIVPGIHDFHLHLVGMARARRSVRLDAAGSLEALLAELRHAEAALPPDAWLSGGGWSDGLMAGSALQRLDEAMGDRAALLYSHDSHSAWASVAARRAAGLTAESPDPPGGRIERGADGVPNGLLREAATDLVEAVAPRARGPALDAALDEVLAELAGFGITGATDAGDTTADNGTAEYAGLGDSASMLFGSGSRLDGRLRLTINVPAAAVDAAAALGLRTGASLPGTSTLRVGWAKAYADGALGSGTAALFERASGGPGSGSGILRMTSEELDEIAAAARAAGIGLAVHAIGDRAVASALDAIGRAPARTSGTPPDRIEHAQLVRAVDRPRFARLGVTASLQPVHVASDRPLAEAAWADRLADAYPWRSLALAGTRLAFGSDAPIETPNPWLGLFAATHRRSPGDGARDWLPDEALDATTALAAYTHGAAMGMARLDEGLLEVGAVADVAVLNTDLATLLAADERLAEVRSDLTLVAGREVRRI
ncbi:MAG: amidohydrolase family protein [Chloroflexota bacterium]|nr:amidohydrolase family protein [Chloroflexota bacterium]